MRWKLRKFLCDLSAHCQCPSSILLLAVTYLDMSPRRSNQDRAKWRIDCRNALSAHIGESFRREPTPLFTKTSEEERLGLFVEPSQVRLVPGPHDPYRRDYPPRLRTLFKRNMSKQTVSVYKALYQGVGKSFHVMSHAPQYSC
jgi:hypothetical protein